MVNFKRKTGGQFGAENPLKGTPFFVVNLQRNQVVNLSGFSIDGLNRSYFHSMAHYVLTKNNAFIVPVAYQELSDSSDLSQYVEFNYIDNIVFWERDFVLSDSAVYYSLNIDNEAYQIDYQVDTIILAINSNTHWTVQTGSNWLTALTPSGRGCDTAMILVSQNMDCTERSDTILLRTVWGNKMVKIAIAQEGASIAPSSLSVSNIASTSVIISWTPGGNETQWEILYGLAGFNPENEGTMIQDISENPYILSGLIPETAYDLYIRAVCDENHVSSWVGPYNFITNPPASLIAYYPFINGSVNDKSGNNHHGTNFGATPAVDKDGNSSNAMSFDGINDYIWLGNDTDFNPSQFSVAAWFKIATGNNYRKIYRWRWSGVTLTVHNGLLEAGVYPLNGYYACHSNSSIADNNWHFTAMTFDSQKIRLFIDGIKIDSTTVPDPVYYGNGGAALGRDGDYNADYFSGILDEVRIYNYPLSLCEINELYNNGQVVTWTGNINSEWNNPGNWSSCGIPNLTSEIVIPDVSPKLFPIITIPGYCKTIRLESGATLIVGPTGSLTVADE